MTTPSQESLSTLLDKVFPGQLKHVREAKAIIKECERLSPSPIKVFKDMGLSEIVRPDFEPGKQPVHYSEKLLKFLKTYHSKDLFRSGHVWRKELNQAVARLDFSSREAFEASLKHLGKESPQSPLDKIDPSLKALPGTGFTARLFPDDNLYGEDWKTPWPEFKRYHKPGTLINERRNDNLRKAYVGDGVLAILTPQEIKKVLTVYVEAAACFEIANHLKSIPWKMIQWPTKKILALYGVDNEFKLWSRYSEDNNVRSMYGSYVVWSCWVRGSSYQCSNALSSTVGQRTYLEALFRWAKHSLGMHQAQVSQESLSYIQPPSFKW